MPSKYERVRNLTMQNRITGAKTVFFCSEPVFVCSEPVFFLKEIRPKITGLKTVNEKKSFLLFLQRIGAGTASLDKKTDPQH